MTPAPEAASRSVDELSAESGLRRVHLVTWRDLEHPDAGGSEIHAATIARHWAAAGLDVTIRTAAVPGGRARLVRDGYQVVRRGGPVTGLVRSPLSELLGANGPRDGLVEVWHGINFLAPLWARGPRIGIAHHVHGDQFRFVLPPPAARVADVLERRVYPRLYRTTPLVTLSRSTRDELLALGHPPEGVSVVSPGVDARFSPGATRSVTPLVATVGRLMPQKRIDVLIAALGTIRDRHPGLELLVVGDGPDRARVVAGAPEWVRFAGRVSDDDLVGVYRQAWLVASASIAEGWNMTITEAGACGTPAVATRIPGHLDAVDHGVSGLLADTQEELAAALDRVLGDGGERERLGAGARRHAARFSWEETARATFAVLAADARRRATR